MGGKTKRVKTFHHASFFLATYDTVDCGAEKRKEKENNRIRAALQWSVGGCRQKTLSKTKGE